jgi:hypothetical protein
MDKGARRPLTIFENVNIFPKQSLSRMALA